MAIVFQAHDPHVKRDVAVKILPTEFLNDPVYRTRFEREALTIAKIDHPLIVPLYDFGEYNEHLFIVMRLMTGGSLADKITKGSLSLTEVVEITSRIAEALDEAHLQHIVHRDLKPPNILFDSWGKAFLSDFGIAKTFESQQSLTMESVIIGTPDYMSPEQARAGKGLDGRSDVYSLGVVLYQMLTGQLPFQADSPIGMALAHINDVAPPLLMVKPTLPPRCQEVISRTLAKTPQERYDTAGDMALALAAVIRQSSSNQDNIPTRVLEVATIKSALSPTLSVLSVTAQPLKERQQLSCGSVRDLAFNADKQGMVIAAGHNVWLSFLSENSAGSLPLLGEIKPLGSHDDWVLSVDWSPDGSKIASGGRDSKIQIWPLSKGETLQLLLEQRGWVWSVAWSPDGTKLASGNDDGSVTIWSILNEQEPLVLLGHTRLVSSVAWSPDGQILASGSDDGTARLWDVKQGKEHYRLAGHVDRVRCVAWSPDGLTLASAGSDGTIRLWEAKSGKLLHMLTGHIGWAEKLAWSRDGTLLASAGSYRDNTVRLWDGFNGKEIAVLTNHVRPVFGVAWLFDGALLASGSADGTIRIWGV